MNYERLKTFITVAEKSSFSEAAKRLFVTQPTITSQVKALEDELDTRLFERTTKKVEMTQAAKVLLDYARDIVQMNDAAHKEISQMEDHACGDLKMGCSLTIGEYFLPEFLKRFNEAYPLIQIQVSIANSTQTVERIKDQVIDVGLIETPIEDESIQMESFLEDELVLIAPPDFITDEDTITLEQIEETPIILREGGSGTREVLKYYLQQAGLSEDDLDIVMELGSTEAVKRVVESGLGVSFISKKAIQKERELALLEAYRINGLKLNRHFYIACRQKQVLKTVSERFLESLRGMAWETMPVH
ncbi:selenium metabolism-associated LysR family transcriptional regulator [Barrientosiimonas marina]|uniref:Selenium metabolism-associated LysR family transcriptional regulator n=1 Tax=Lentibacillus kimchii TaxID=1542911 RepID=A0ABW2UZD3_9BACI